MKYSLKDLRQAGAREFRTVPTGNWIVCRNGRRKQETVGTEYIPTRCGRFELSEWHSLIEDAILEEGMQALLSKIENHVRERCAWLSKEKEIHEYALECLSSEAYKHWKDFKEPGSSDS